MQPRKLGVVGIIKGRLRVLALALITVAASVGAPSLAAADAAPEPGGCDCNQAPGNAGQKYELAANGGKRRLGVAVFAVLVAGAFLYSARRVRHKNPRR